MQNLKCGILYLLVVLTMKRTYNWTPLCFLIICFLVRIVFGVSVNRAFLLF